MTIGIAAKYSDGLILGSDSQLTMGDAPYKTQGTKIERIGRRVGLVGAGSTDFYRDLVRRLGERREGIDGQEMPAVADIVSATMAEMYCAYASRFGKDIEGAVGLAPVQLLVAGLNQDDTPRIFHVRPPGIYGPEDQFGIVGSGVFYAGHVLRRRRTAQMDFKTAGKLVTRAIKETAEMDPYVGGDINLVVIGSDIAKIRDGDTFEPRFGEFYLGHFLNQIRAEDMIIDALLGDVEGSDKVRQLAVNMNATVEDIMREERQERI